MTQLLTQILGTQKQWFEEKMAYYVVSVVFLVFKVSLVFLVFLVFNVSLVFKVL